MSAIESLIKSYEFDIADLEADIERNGSTPAAERTLKRLRAKLRKLRHS
jgi:hypothetical protein